MLETAVASMRFATSMLLGRPFRRRTLDGIVEAMRQTREEFGAIGSDGAELVGGPRLDEESRRMMQGRRFRAQARRAATETPYYQELFARLGVDPRRTGEDVTAVPVTTKTALRADPAAFVRRSARPDLRVTTTGTTAEPTTVWFSSDEVHTIGALSAMSFLSQGVMGPEDLVQISISTRATLGVAGIARAAEAIGAGLHVAGLVGPEHTLRLLAERHRLPGRVERVSVLQTYPSHLGELLETARRLGYRSSDFGVRRILVGGEIFTSGLERRARELFGPVEFVRGYGMTELLPMTATRCSDGHLHFEASAGLVEVQSLDDLRPARTGEPGTIVATPFPPYRQTTMLLRYDTEDVVAPVDGQTTCELRNVPFTGDVLGKRRLSARHDGGWTFVRDVAEAVEAVGRLPLPARYGFWAVPGGVAVEVVAPHGGDDTVRREVGSRLEQSGVPVRQLRLVEDPSELHHPVPLRCDLREGAFRGPTASSGAVAGLAAGRAAS
ncbi:MAG TPA: AMP-binding protein [Acidimicrobiales bacterium]|nr:AMP-binding protein [Acidimicrobiales bacterium]